MKRLFIVFAVAGLLMGCQKTDNSVTPPQTYAPAPTEEPEIIEMGGAGGNKDTSTSTFEVLEIPK